MLAIAYPYPYPGPYPSPPAGPGALDPDALLVAACQRGQPGALERVVERFQAAVVGTALRLVGDREVALEVTNATFFKLSRSLDRYDPGRPLRPWLLRIAANEALNWLRRRHRERERLVGGLAGAAALAHAVGGPDPEAEMLAAERREAVRAALIRLPDRQRRLLALRFFHQLSYAEIGHRTGQDKNTVGVQLLRARRRLRDELHRGGFSFD
jgi:RNA polymerase sigma-70 factor (ECF subfamily)